MKRIIPLLVFFAFIILAKSGNAQSVTLSRVEGLKGPDTVLTGQVIDFYVRMTSNDIYYSGFSSGFRVYSNDDVNWTATYPDTVSHGWKEFFDLFFKRIPLNVDGIGADTVGYAGAKFESTGLPPNFDEEAFKISIGPISTAYHKKEICLDSSFYPNAGLWKWSGPTVIPSWDGPHCFTIWDPLAPADPSNIVLSASSVDFVLTEGDPPPPVQTVTVSSDLNPFTVSVSESSSWISVAPSSGTTPLDVSVSVNPGGLSFGTYYDSVMVTAPLADNSPQWFYVNLTINPPPAEIQLNPGQFYFNAVAGEANPDSRILEIINTGVAQLNWSLSNSESWLSFDTYSGIDDAQVNVMVDITGLAFGEYYDTIIVTDPDAVNSPQTVPVFLSVGSDLPLIAVDSAFNTVIVQAGEITADPRMLHITNGGSGTMTFSLSENSSHIISLSPLSGLVPDSVEVGLKVIGGAPGDDYYDTLWIHSDEAVNSPFPVVFWFHFVEFAEQLYVTPKTISFDVYGCSMGRDNLYPQKSFSIDYLPQLEPLTYNLSYDTTYFNLEVTNGTYPFNIRLVAKKPTIPIGTYYDTIQVSAINAINSPQLVIVEYNVLEPETPEMFLQHGNLNLTYQETETPKVTKIGVINKNPGCMPWQMAEDASWIFPDKLASDVPGFVNLGVTLTGHPMGEYFDTLLFTAEDAFNSPQSVPVSLIVWRYRGDVNFDGYIAIDDVVLLINYLFGDGFPEPYPENRVADVNCDLKLDIDDLVYLIEYGFGLGPKPCTNP